MIVAHYSKKYSLKELVKLVNPENKSAISLWDLSQAAGKIGFNEISIASDYRLLTEEVPLPCIAHWQNNHFIVVYRIRHDSVDVADPALGLRTYHKEEFCKSWLNANEARTEGILMLLEPKK